MNIPAESRISQHSHSLLIGEEAKSQRTGFQGSHSRYGQNPREWGQLMSRDLTAPPDPDVPYLGSHGCSFTSLLKVGLSSAFERGVERAMMLPTLSP